MLSSTKNKYMFIIYELGNKGNTFQAKQRSVSYADFLHILEKFRSFGNEATK